MTAIAGAADIGGTNTRVALIRDDGSILGVERFTTPAGQDPGVVPAAVATGLSRLMASLGIDSICGLGLSVAGPVDLATGSISHPPNMAFDLVPLTEPLREIFRKPVFLMNDCRAAVLGEMFFGSGRNHCNVVYITFSTGIGGGVCSDGVVLNGRGGNAGEIGHFYVETSILHPCTCGHAGHWEGCSSGRGMPGFFSAWCTARGVDPDPSFTTASRILSAGERGDPVILSFLDEIARINARGLSSVIVAYDPEIIIVDGPLITAHPDLLLPAAVQYIDQYLEIPEIIISPLGGSAPLIGAAARVFDSASHL